MLREANRGGGDTSIRNEPLSCFTSYFGATQNKSRVDKAGRVKRIPITGPIVLELLNLTRGRIGTSWIAVCSRGVELS